MKRFLHSFLYPLSLFFWVAWYWLVPLGLVALIALAFLAGLLLR